MKTYIAYADLVIGPKLVNQFMIAADLDCKAGVKQTISIDYKPGEEVDHARVKKALDHMMKEFNASDSEYEILTYDNVRVELKEASDEG